MINHRSNGAPAPVRLILAGVLAVLLAGLPAVASAAAAPYCATSTPVYRFGFADLYSRLGTSVMGQPIECEHADPKGTGDTLQQTTRGLAFYRKSTNTPTFTDGYQHYALTPRGLVQWVGSSIDPPAVQPLTTQEQQYVRAFNDTVATANLVEHDVQDVLDQGTGIPRREAFNRIDYDYQVWRQVESDLAALTPPLRFRRFHSLEQQGAAAYETFLVNLAGLYYYNDPSYAQPAAAALVRRNSFFDQAKQEWAAIVP